MSEAVLPSVAAGDSDAVERCLDRYGGLVWSLARRYFARPADAEDAVQEAFLSVWENARRFDPSVASETTYVAMIARRRIIDLVRRGKAARRTMTQNDVSRLDAPPPIEELADPGATTFEADGVALLGFEVAEEAQRVRVQLARLSEDQQRVLRLALCEGQSQTQIADLTGWPLGTVKSHARRGLSRLRELLAEETRPVTTKQEADR
ncbi:ECF RNA polymerase sigma factor RpoE [Botrimarina colliarenosi]|uniref:ECF RNA polymerase sigma factor RpoE n=1 Tax=Botrimarina colliarenosi TaxID=2528001 RepID=A0A5C6AK41_9BACT|nr:sigma-70 family RNA polymerase sigma factor [Botrimarina colliarenosi]TWU00415.1 ECF RNA polymerase sigma factor RpoE [Botrimarina colliarenosi]